MTTRSKAGDTLARLDRQTYAAIAAGLVMSLLLCWLIILPALIEQARGATLNSRAIPAPRADRRPRMTTFVLPTAAMRGRRLFDAHGNPGRVR